jgi:hypothetical protein
MFFFLHCLANVSKKQIGDIFERFYGACNRSVWRPPKVNMTSVQHDFGQYKPCTAILMIQYLYVYIYTIYIYINTILYNGTKKRRALWLNGHTAWWFQPAWKQYIYRDIYSSNGIIIGRKKQTYIYNIIENIYIYIYIYTYKYQCIYIEYYTTIKHK